MADIRKELKGISGIKVSLRDNSARGLTSGRQFPVSFNISGPDLFSPKKRLRSLSLA